MKRECLICRFTDNEPMERVNGGYQHIECVRDSGMEADMDMNHGESSSELLDDGEGNLTINDRRELNEYLNNNPIPATM